MELIQIILLLSSSFSDSYNELLQAWEKCGSDNLCKAKELVELVTALVGVARPTFILSKLVEKGINNVSRWQSGHSMVQSGSKKEKTLFVVIYFVLELGMTGIVHWVRYSAECLSFEDCEPEDDIMVWIMNMRTRYCPEDPDEDDGSMVDCDADENNCEESIENRVNLCVQGFNSLPIIMFAGVTILINLLSLLFNVNIDDDDPPSAPSSPRPPPEDSKGPEQPANPSRDPPQPPKDPPRDPPQPPKDPPRDPPQPPKDPPQSPIDPPRYPSQPPKNPPPSQPSSPSEPQPSPVSPAPSQPKGSQPFSSNSKSKKSLKCAKDSIQEVEVHCPCCKHDYVTVLPDPVDIFCTDCCNPRGEGHSPRNLPTENSGAQQSGKVRGGSVADNPDPGTSFCAKSGLAGRMEVHLCQAHSQTENHSVGICTQRKKEEVSDSDSDSSIDEEEMRNYLLDYVNNHKEELLQTLEPHCDCCDSNHCDHYHVYDSDEERGSDGEDLADSDEEEVDLSESEGDADSIPESESEEKEEELGED